MPELKPLDRAELLIAGQMTVEQATCILCTGDIDEECGACEGIGRTTAGHRCTSCWGVGRVTPAHDCPSAGLQPDE